MLCNIKHPKLLGAAHHTPFSLDLLFSCPPCQQILILHIEVSYISTLLFFADVRLVSTDSRTYAGRIEVFFNNKWGQICYQGNSTVLSVVCAQLGYGSAGAIPFSISNSRNAPIWLDNDIECVGDEDTIFDCPSLEFTDIGKVVGGYCSDGAAGVICPVGRFCKINC